MASERSTALSAQSARSLPAARQPQSPTRKPERDFFGSSVPQHYSGYTLAQNLFRTKRLLWLPPGTSEKARLAGLDQDGLWTVIGLELAGAGGRSERNSA